MYADEFLAEEDIGFELVEQDRPTHRCKDSAEERGVSETEIVKSIIGRTDGEYRQFLLPGNYDLDTDAELAPDDRVEELTGFEPGTVHPFA
ncbi:MAG: YbaK/EbsC family protein, partial [Candidatus Nanohaloarchaea archaeon]|nr:YbaK/EbsC family protein [Candidatus Nanohaloarchaea archaeon]